MKRALFFCASLLVLGGILWTTGIFRKKGNQSILIDKHFDKLDDFIGTVWENDQGKSTIYFLSPDHLVYSFFDPAVYEDNGKRKIRKVCDYNFMQSFKTFSISRLGMQFGVNLVVRIDTLKQDISLYDLENNQVWQPETEMEYVNKTK
jgi:hypothetical protein